MYFLITVSSQKHIATANVHALKESSNQLEEPKIKACNSLQLETV